MSVVIKQSIGAEVRPPSSSHPSPPTETEKKFIDGGDIDLDKEVVIRADGTRITEADAEAQAEEVVRYGVMFFPTFHGDFECDFIFDGEDCENHDGDLYRVIRNKRDLTEQEVLCGEHVKTIDYDDLTCFRISVQKIQGLV